MNCSVICVIDTGPGPGKFSQCESSSMTSTTFTNRPLVSLHVGDRNFFCFTCDGEQDNRTEDPINGYFNCAEIFNLTYYNLYLIVCTIFSLNISKLSSIRFNVIIFYIRYLICLYQITVIFIHLMRVITVYSIWRVRDRSVIRITEITC